MAEPHSTAAAAALTGAAAAIPAAGIAAALGVPLDLLGWAMFGGLVVDVVFNLIASILLADEPARETDLRNSRELARQVLRDYKAKYPVLP